MAARVLSTDQAKSAITQIQAIINGGLTEQISKLDSQGKVLSNPDVWDGPLAQQFQGIIENLRQRYVLSYTSTNSKHDGAWRHVEIRPRASSLVVTSSGGYFAPRP